MSLRASAHTGVAIRSPIHVTFTKSFQKEYGLPRSLRSLAMTGWWTICGEKNAGTTLFWQKGSPFLSVHRCRAVAKIDVFLCLDYVNQHYRRCAPGGVWGGGFDCGSNKANPPQPASTVAFLPEQESYPPEEPHLQLLQRVSFSTQKLAITTVIARGRIATPVTSVTGSQ